ASAVSYPLGMWGSWIPYVWMARGPDAAAGCRVRVIGQQGAILLVEPAE
ncbi:MAG: NfeD family protein, partial [Pseudomonas sp.]